MNIQTFHQHFALYQKKDESSPRGQLVRRRGDCGYVVGSHLYVTDDSAMLSNVMQVVLLEKQE